MQKERLGQKSSGEEGAIDHREEEEEGRKERSSKLQEAMWPEIKHTQNEIDAKVTVEKQSREGCGAGGVP